MGFEIDFLAVGDESRSGDAIALRWGDLHGSRSNQWIAIIDGGTQEAGKRLSEFVRSRYGTDTVDLVLSTHPDQDHVAGLHVVVDELKVGTLLIHRPWTADHTNNIADLFKSGRVSDASVRERLRKSLDQAHALTDVAQRKGITITEPFAGCATPDGAFRILGPTRALYGDLLPYFRGTPEPKGSLFDTAQRGVAKAAAAALRWVGETFEIETLEDKEDTSPENNSSAIAMLTVDGRSCLFTADAGKAALSGALDHLDESGFDYGSLRFVQVPHHGSRRNVGPTILNRLLGAPQSSDAKSRSAFVSAAKKGAPKHPARKVCNAFRRRGAHVFATQGSNIWHHFEAPERSDYSSLEPLPFYDQVEEEA